MFAWHTAALAGRNPPTHIDTPRCGWFKTRLVKGGVWCPARIWLVQEIDPDTGELAADEVMRCEIAGERRNPVTAWVGLARFPIAEAEYERMMQLLGLPVFRATHAPVPMTETPMRPR